MLLMSCLCLLSVQAAQSSMMCVLFGNSLAVWAVVFIGVVAERETYECACYQSAGVGMALAAEALVEVQHKYVHKLHFPWCTPRATIQENCMMCKRRNLP